MLKKIYRLTNNKDFQIIYRRGRYYTTPFFNLHTLSNKGTFTKIGVVASKKISKKAVIRNLAKRRVREITKESYSDIIPGQNIIITIKPAIIDADIKDIRTEFRKALSKLDLIKR